MFVAMLRVADAVLVVQGGEVITVSFLIAVL